MITANSAGKTYGQTAAFAGTAFTSSGLVNGDMVSSVTETSTGSGATAAAGSDPSAQARLAWRLALATDPGPDDVAEAVSFLARQRDDFAASGLKNLAGASPARLALATYCQALLSSNAFLYVD